MISEASKLGNSVNTLKQWGGEVVISLNQSNLSTVEVK